MKIITACFLLLASLLFIFTPTQVFDDNADRYIEVFAVHFLWQDITSFNPLPIFFFAGILAICAYISFLVYRVNSKTFYSADRFDLWYKMLFSLILIYICIRSLFIVPYLNVPLELVIIAVASGLFNWLIPPIICNNSEEF
ncbi:MAG: hypothetical protein FWE45_00885 [Firmicutes bacterium]|nr:hypothetical protein [Bacillota bacterium]